MPKFKVGYHTFITWVILYFVFFAGYILGSMYNKGLTGPDFMLIAAFVIACGHGFIWMENLPSDPVKTPREKDRISITSICMMVLLIPAGIGMAYYLDADPKASQHSARYFIPMIALLWITGMIVYRVWNQISPLRERRNWGG